MNVVGLDHISLHVSNLQLSLAFYTDIIGLRPVPRPAFDFEGAWLSIGNGQTLHLIAGRTQQVLWGSRGTHMAFAVSDVEQTAAYFQTKGIEHTPIKPRPDGVRQFFVTDPDGYCIEFCQTIGK
ncbi:MAG: VOC family protein [Cytophagales bacterium]|nr:VOC family protein [Bernardetiaceae bacterium]MDW8205616.1 VOC family protein [Cytophagales bacterium]